MNCRAAKKHMMPYIEGMLDGAIKLQFEQHLTSCESCREECKAIGRMQRVLQSAAPEVVEPAPDLWARVNAQIQPEQTARVSRPRWKSAPAVGAVVMVLIGIAIIPMYYNSSRQMMVATKTTSHDMLAAPGMKGMPGMPGMGGLAPQMAPVSPSGGVGMAGEFHSNTKINTPTLRLRKSKPAASVMMSKVPVVRNYSTIDRDTSAETGETRHKEAEVKLNVASPMLDPSILAKTRSESANGPAKMAKVAPLRLFQETEKNDANNRLNTVAPAPSANTLMDMKLESPQTFSEVAKATTLGAQTMPGGLGGAVMSESVDAVKAAPKMAGAPGMPGMGAPAVDKGNGDFLSTSGTQAKVSDMGSQVAPTPYGMIAVLEFQVKAGKKEAAISLADKLHTMQKVDQKTWYRLGEIEEKLERKSKALEAYRKSTDGSDKEIARKASTQIKRLAHIIHD
jgi:hypothetical protein